MQPITFNHIGLSVPDIDKAIDVYKELFGWYHLAGPYTIKRESPSGPFTDTVYGTDWTGFRLAHMSTGNGIGIELLEFEGNYPAKDKLEFKKNGIFHFGVTVVDYEAFIKKLESMGGRQHSAINKRDVKGQKRDLVFGEDPFGNIFEIYTYNYEVMTS